MTEQEEEILKLIAFSTNDKENNPLELIDVFLNQSTSSILKKGNNSIAFSTKLSGTTNLIKIMVTLILKFNKKIDYIMEVNSYIIFIDLRMNDVKKKIEEIIDYIGKNCNLNIKYFIVGMNKGEEDNSPLKITQEEIKEFAEKIPLSFEYLEIDLSDKKSISDKINKIFRHCSKSKKENEKNEMKNMKPEGEAKSCFIY